MHVSIVTENTMCSHEQSLSFIFQGYFESKKKNPGFNSFFFVVVF